MGKKRTVDRSGRHFSEFDSEVRGYAPNLYGWSSDPDNFAELRLKARPDGTILAIAKGFGPDGGPVVCFGVGYGIVGAVMAIDATIQGGKWRVDKPWSPPKE